MQEFVPDPLDGDDVIAGLLTLMFMTPIGWLFWLFIFFITCWNLRSKKD